MNHKMKLPVGYDDFRKIRQEGLYYIDKTNLIEQLLESGGEVNLFTRPRRFGKTLNMSMLQAFFELNENPRLTELFDGLYVSERKDLCEKYMGKFPVIFLSLKAVDALDFETARYRLVELMAREAGRFRFLLDSAELQEDDKEIYRSIIAQKNGEYTMTALGLVSSLRNLSELLYKHYKKQVIILIDEYDVPMDKAFTHGYYQEMVSLMRGFLRQALETNEFLHFAVLTGCLGISRESIFTGLNNFKILSITDTPFDEGFGFTDAEVQKLLADYHLEDHWQEVKEWYDGYHFGDTDIYCPWDVMNHVDRLLDDSQAEPQAYWLNTSGNDLVKRFIDKADRSTRDEIERLIAGETIEKNVRLDLTYEEVDQSLDNLWSILFTTGYLTQMGRAKAGVYQLIIPNKEVREVFICQIQEWFQQKLIKKNDQVEEFLQSLEVGDAETAEKALNHILIEPEDPDAGIIVEIKYAQTVKDLEKACQRALTQIEEKHYDEYFHNEDRNEILSYGVAFCKKRCKIRIRKYR